MKEAVFHFVYFWNTMCCVLMVNYLSISKNKRRTRKALESSRLEISCQKKKSVKRGTDGQGGAKWAHRRPQVVCQLNYCYELSTLNKVALLCPTIFTLALASGWALISICLLYEPLVLYILISLLFFFLLCFTHNRCFIAARGIISLSAAELLSWHLTHCLCLCNTSVEGNNSVSNH